MLNPTSLPAPLIRLLSRTTMTREDNLMMRWLRNESLGALLSVFKPGDNLLEIGCGTGEEALILRNTA